MKDWINAGKPLNGTGCTAKFAAAATLQVRSLHIPGDIYSMTFILEMSGTTL